MGFRDREEERIVGLRDSIFKDPGSGLFFSKPREFVLSDPALNLWEVQLDIYFRRKSPA
jgi:hypothetical protein